MKQGIILPAFIILLFCCLGCGLVCCTGKVDPESGVELNKVKLSLKSPVVCTPGQTVSCGFSEGLGPMKSDEVVLRRESSEDVVMSIISMDNTTFQYKLPATFEYGTYSFCLRRNSVLRGFGKVAYSSGSSSTEVEEIKPEAGSTVYGVVSCNGKGLADVVVSDGVEVVKTDKNGVYQMRSDKKNGYVFVSIPSGYEVASDGVLPQFHKYLIKSQTAAERVDFTLFESGDQNEHTMLYFGDMHLANRTNDRKQFSLFTKEIDEYVKAHKDEKVYALTLGDMTWDQFWYKNLYGFEQYLKDVNVIGNLQIFHTIGNHDHDMNATGDFDTVVKFRRSICPTNYSFNIGKIHYIVLDDIECTNASASTTDASVRSYRNNLVDEALSWLRKDLSYVSKNTPVVLTMHAPLYDKDGGNSLRNAQALTTALYGYNATLVTGHSHVIYNITNNSVREYNSGAVCAAWWWAGKYNPSFNLATDGAPNGYRINTVKGTLQQSRFKAVGRSDSYQFRAYDRNSICLKAENYGVSSSRASVLYEEDYGGYRNSLSDNTVLINVWDWDPSWKVEVSEDGKALAVSQVKNSYDPAFLIAYTIPRLKESSSVSWHQSKINHMFKAKATSATSTLEIKVTDDEGRVYTETMTRPRSFTVANYE